MIEIVLQRLFAASIETTVAAIVAAVVAALLGRRAPRAVAILWLVVLAKPLLTLAGVAPVRLPLPAPAMQQQRDVARDAAGGTADVHVIRMTKTSTPALAIVWFAGALLFAAGTLRDRLRLRTIVASTREPSARLASAYAELSPNPAPRLRVSEVLDGPAIAGVLRPTILIPAWMERDADDAQITWTLRHELRHAAARDLAGVALREVALIVFWFHPVVRFAAHKWEAATELACDRDVVSSDTDAVVYAEALLRTLGHVRRQQSLRLASGLFATRSKIGTRISALLDRPLARRSRIGAVAAIAIGIAVVAVGGGVREHFRGTLRGEIEEVNDRRSYTLRFEGVIDADHLARDGFVEMRESRGGTTRRLTLEQTSGGIVRTYAIDGHAAPPDAQFEERMKDALRHTLHH